MEGPIVPPPGNLDNNADGDANQPNQNNDNDNNDNNAPAGPPNTPPNQPQNQPPNQPAPQQPPPNQPAPASPTGPPQPVLNLSQPFPHQPAPQIIHQQIGAISSLNSLASLKKMLKHIFCAQMTGCRHITLRRM